MSIYRIKDNVGPRKRSAPKLDATKVVWARHRYFSDNRPMREIATALDVAVSTIYSAILGHTWVQVYPNKYHWNKLWRVRIREGPVTQYGGCKCEQCELVKRKWAREKSAI